MSHVKNKYRSLEGVGCLFLAWEVIASSFGSGLTKGFGVEGSGFRV